MPFLSTPRAVALALALSLPLESAGAQSTNAADEAAIVALGVAWQKA